MDNLSNNQSKLFYLAVGILVPLVVALIPHLYGLVFPERDLTFKIISSTKVKIFQSVNVSVSNNGEKLEKNVKLYLRKSIACNCDDLKATFVEIEPSDKHELSINEDNLVISIGDMRPSETKTISVLSPALDALIASSNFTRDYMVVKSEENLGKLDEESEIIQVFSPIAFWLLLILLGIIICFGFYYDFLQSKEQKINRINALIDKYKTEIDKLNKS